MPKWLVMEETVIAEGAAPHQRVLRSLSGNKTRDQALEELRKVAKRHRPDCLKKTQCVVGQDSDGSFWILPKNGKGHARCNLRLIEQTHP
ncbi:hypothetical protein ABZ752_07505 [Streptomyces roseifaciens]